MYLTAENKCLISFCGSKSLTLVRAQDAFKEFLLHEQFCSLGDTSASALLSKVPSNHEVITWITFIIWSSFSFLK